MQTNLTGCVGVGDRRILAFPYERNEKFMRTLTAADGARPGENCIGRVRTRQVARPHAQGSLPDLRSGTFLRRVAPGTCAPEEAGRVPRHPGRRQVVFRSLRVEEENDAPRLGTRRTCWDLTLGLDPDGRRRSARSWLCSGQGLQARPLPPPSTSMRYRRPPRTTCPTSKTAAWSVTTWTAALLAAQIQVSDPGWDPDLTTTDTYTYTVGGSPPTTTTTTVAPSTPPVPRAAPPPPEPGTGATTTTTPTTTTVTVTVRVTYEGLLQKTASWWAANGIDAESGGRSAGQRGPLRRRGRHRHPGAAGLQPRHPAQRRRFITVQRAARRRPHRRCVLRRSCRDHQLRPSDRWPAARHPDPGRARRPCHLQPGQYGRQRRHWPGGHHHDFARWLGGRGTLERKVTISRRGCRGRVRPGGCRPGLAAGTSSGLRR